MTNKAKSDLSQAIYNTAQGLYKTGTIDKQTINKFKVMCLVPEYDGEAIKNLRDKLNISQAVLAAIMNTSLSSVRQWEQNNRHPQGIANKMLYVLEKNGIEAFL